MICSYSDSPYQNITAATAWDYRLPSLLFTQSQSLQKYYISNYSEDFSPCCYFIVVTSFIHTTTFLTKILRQQQHGTTDYRPYNSLSPYKNITSAITARTSVLVVTSFIHTTTFLTKILRQQFTTKKGIDIVLFKCYVNKNKLIYNLEKRILDFFKT